MSLYCVGYVLVAIVDLRGCFYVINYFCWNAKKVTDVLFEFTLILAHSLNWIIHLEGHTSRTLRLCSQELNVSTPTTHAIKEMKAERWRCSSPLILHTSYCIFESFVLIEWRRRQWRGQGQAARVHARGGVKLGNGKWNSNFKHDTRCTQHTHNNFHEDMFLLLKVERCKGY